MLLRPSFPPFNRSSRFTFSPPLTAVKILIFQVEEESVQNRAGIYDEDVIILTLGTRPTMKCARCNCIPRRHENKRPRIKMVYFSHISIVKWLSLSPPLSIFPQVAKECHRCVPSRNFFSFLVPILQHISTPPASASLPFCPPKMRWGIKKLLAPLFFFPFSSESMVTKLEPDLNIPRKRVRWRITPRMCRGR